jgi:hypothetical protein
LDISITYPYLSINKYITYFWIYPKSIHIYPYIEIDELSLRLISEYRSRRGIGGDAGSAGGPGKKKDTSQYAEDVLLCRGSRIRTRIQVAKKA